MFIFISLRRRSKSPFFCVHEFSEFWSKIVTQEAPKLTPSYGLTKSIATPGAIPSGKKTHKLVVMLIFIG